MQSSGVAESGAPELSYFFSSKNDILVISMSGVLDTKSLPVLQRCFEEALSNQARFVIFNLGDLQEVDRAGAAEFIRFQKAIRARPAQVRVCAMSIAMKENLEGFGALRGPEVATSLLDAVNNVAKSK